VVKIATFAKPENVIGQAIKTTKQNYKDEKNHNRNTDINYNNNIDNGTI